MTLTYAYYNLDTVGFIEKLCENKDKPELQCNGKCHLKKVVENNTNNDKYFFNSNVLSVIFYKMV